MCDVMMILKASNVIFVIWLGGGDIFIRLGRMTATAELGPIKGV